MVRYTSLAILLTCAAVPKSSCLIQARTKSHDLCWHVICLGPPHQTPAAEQCTFAEALVASCAVAALDDEALITARGHHLRGRATPSLRFAGEDMLRQLRHGVLSNVIFVPSASVMLVLPPLKVAPAKAALAAEPAAPP